MELKFNILIYILIILYFYNIQIREHFIEYDMNNKRYISVKNVNKYFVNQEFQIDSHVRHFLPNNLKILVKEYKFMTGKEKKNLKNIFVKCFDISEYDWSDDTLIIHYYIKNKLVGYIGALTTRQFEKWLSKNSFIDSKVYGMINQHGLYIYNLCVLPEYRKMGIGTILITSIINLANQIRANYISLVVKKKNNNAIKLYKKFQFTHFRETIDKKNNKNITMIKYI